MVRLRSLNVNGLLSYDDKGEDSGGVVALSKSTVIVGPNDSGKSNLFRILELFVQSLLGTRRLREDEIFPDVTQPSLEVPTSE
jgi:chromosome segregation ATPase